jgi:hypothetical protein
MDPCAYTPRNLLLNTLPAPSTLAILGMPLSAKHDGYRNKRALQDAVRAGKEKEAPAGLQWNGNLKLCQVHVNSYLTSYGSSLTRCCRAV